MIAVKYRSLFDTKPIGSFTDWEQLVDAFSTSVESVDKERGALWAPVALTEGGRRRNADVERVTALVLDVDGGTAYAEARDALREKTWIAYSTYSHTPESPRFHVVMRLDEAVSGSLWPTEYRKLKERIGFGDNLPAPSHSYFLPQHKPGAEWFFESYAPEKEGKK